MRIEIRLIVVLINIEKYIMTKNSKKSSTSYILLKHSQIIQITSCIVVPLMRVIQSIHQ